ncbi:hypothetical protein [Streptomyces beigongshangae]|nr:hypothetical protein [Streptomyces sp. REN17]
MHDDFEMSDEWFALPRRHLPEGDMIDIYRKLFLIPLRHSAHRNETVS